MSQTPAYLIKPFNETDIQTIVGEVEFLVKSGWRDEDANQILEGVRVALEGSPRKDWERWTKLPLHMVIDDLFYLGTP